MKKNNSGHHFLSVLFPVLLLCVFAVCAILVVTLGARVYGNIVKRSEKTGDVRTCLSYVTEKIRRSDEEGSVTVTEKDGTDVLVLAHTSSGASGNAVASSDPAASYYTFIYVYNGSLYELSALEGTDIAMDAGTAILPLQEMDMETINSHLLQITCTTEDGKEYRALVNVQSGIR